MKTKITLLVSFLMLSFSMMAQYQVSGTVNDGDGQPLPGVSVQVEGTDNGTATDFDGNYSLKVNKGDVLEFTSVGFESISKTMDGSTTVDVSMASGLSLDEVVVVGSRNPNRVATDTAVPVDVIDVTEITKLGAQVNLNQILNYVAPSFTSNTQTISDGTDHIDPASLRGLGPDQVLVLINGKRRHNSSLVNVNGTFGRGSVGTDLNAIPSASISRIEVLRDGAAAQYGSDAIAGVINIVLKKSTDELTFNVTTGAYFSENANDQTGGSDGETTNVSANYGLKLGENGGFVNFTGDFDVREHYSRMKEFEGGIFHAYNAIERLALAQNLDISNLADSDVVNLANGYLSAPDAAIVNGFSSTELHTPTQTDDDGNITFYNPLSNNVTEAELTARGQDRTDYNMRVGQSALRGGRFFANFSLPLNDEGAELYSFAGISSRVGNSAGFYRLPSQNRTYTPAYNNGFLPEINSAIKDKSFSVGIKGKISDWDVDFSNTWGRNSFLFKIGNTFNASLQSASPTTFDAGGFAFAQNTTNLDVSKFFEDKLEGLNIAFGAEYRVENYEIFAGEEASYAQYDSTGNVNNTFDDIIRDGNGDPILDIDGNTQTNNANPSVLVPTDFFGRSRPGGSQVFPGFSPDNELSRGRSSVAGYFDIEADFTEAILVSFATRFEDYSDFGSTVNFKLASRIKATENVNVRAAINTGFRAPSLHQLNFNSTSTIFDQDGNPIEVGTFANDSRAAQLLGIPQLKEETSQSVSLGFTAKIPSANLTVTLDGYLVNIDDRVVYTGRFEGPGTGTELDRLLAQANAGAAAFFANAIDTKSTGVDVVITHKTNFGEMKLKSDLAGTFSKTERDGDIHASQILIDAGLEATYFDEASRVYLEEAVPNTKVSLSNTLIADKFNVFLRNVYFGEVTEATNNVTRQQVFGTKVVTDLSFGYNVNDALTFTVGANNLLDVFPDRAKKEFSDGGTNRSSGRFDWSRRAQQFGIGGRFIFARMSFKLK